MSSRLCSPYNFNCLPRRKEKELKEISFKDDDDDNIRAAQPSGVKMGFFFL